MEELKKLMLKYNYPELIKTETIETLTKRFNEVEQLNEIEIEQKLLEVCGNGKIEKELNDTNKRLHLTVLTDCVNHESGKEVISIDEYTNKLIKNYKIITTMEKDNLMIYENGIYKGNTAQSKVCELTQAIFKDKMTNHKINEIVQALKRKTYINDNYLDNQLDLIHLKNGIYNMKAKTFEPFDHRVLSTVQIPIKYNKEAKAPKIEKFMKEILPSQNERDIIQEMIGYCLYKDYPTAKSIMLLGGGSNGKSTLINLIKKFLGLDNVSAVALQDLETSRFSVSLLHGKLANLYPDLSSKAMGQISKFKALTGKDMITAERKFGQPFNFTNYAKMIFSCNELPKIEEDSDAVWRRWIIINFKEKFEGKNDNKKMIDELTTEDELSGFFNWAVIGLERVLENGFSQSETTAQVRENYIKKSNPLKAFITEAIIEKADGSIFKDDLYGAFVKYCKDNSLPIVADNIFAKSLISEISGIRQTRISFDGERRTAWSGISFFKELKDEPKQKVIIDNCQDFVSDMGKI